LTDDKLEPVSSIKKKDLRKKRKLRPTRSILDAFSSIFGNSKQLETIKPDDATSVIEEQQAESSSESGLSAIQR
jgi:hypothetical protein